MLLPTSSKTIMTSMRSLKSLFVRAFRESLPPLSYKTSDNNGHRVSNLAPVEQCPPFDEPEIRILDWRTTYQALIDSLPYEILVEIFSYIFPVQSSGSQATIRYCLSSVCRRWRSVILGTSWFWNEIRITPSIGLFRDEESDHLSSKLGPFLLRAGNIPVDLTWDMPGISPEQTINIFKVLAQHVPLRRWRTLKVGEVTPFLECAEEYLLGELSNLQQVSFSASLVNFIGRLVERTAVNLKGLRLDQEEAPYAQFYFPNTLSKVSSLSIADANPFIEEDIPPNVKYLSLRKLASAPASPFAAITNLNVTFFSLDQLALLFFPNLEYLQGKLEGSVDRIDHVVSMPRLRILDIEVTYRSCPSIIYISAPRLTELCLSTRRNAFRFIDPLVYMDMGALNTQEELSPTILTVQCYSDVSTLSRFLQRFPRVEHLTINVSSSKIRKMFTSPSLNGMLPELITLRLELARSADDVEDWRKFATELLKTRTLESVTCVGKDGTEVKVRADTQFNSRSYFYVVNV